MSDEDIFSTARDASTTAARSKIVAPTLGTSGGGGLGVRSVVRLVKGLPLVTVKERELGVVLCGGKIDGSDVTEVKLRTHPPKDIHQDLVGFRYLIGMHGEGMGPETNMETLARLNTAIEGLQGVSLPSKGPE
jgi:hypothetical protein